jgi:hypothetical protein
MRTIIQVKLEGHRNQYYVLLVYKDETSSLPFYVHTSKDISYLRRLVKERFSK